jgi:hypothetical protein
MAQKFDPAPHDRHAAAPAKAAAEDQEMHEKLLSGLVGSFPASDPPSVSQPSPSRHDAVQARHDADRPENSHPESSLWAKIAGIFR